MDNPKKQIIHEEKLELLDPFMAFAPKLFEEKHPDEVWRLEMELKVQEVRVINRVLIVKANNGVNLTLKTLEVNFYKP